MRAVQFAAVLALAFACPASAHEGPHEIRIAPFTIPADAGPVVDVTVSVDPAASQAPVLRPFAYSAAEPDTWTNPIGSAHGKNYAVRGNLLMRRDGDAWAVVRSFPSSPSRVFEAGADDLIVATRGHVFRRTDGEWTQKWAITDTSYITGFSSFGDGENFAFAEYAPNRADSNIAIGSRDGGRTFSTIYDADVIHGPAARGSHLHGVAYDSVGGVWLVVEGHGDIRCVRFNPDPFGDPTNWPCIEGGSLGGGVATAGPNTSYPGGEPTNVVPLPGGIVLGSDGYPFGLWRIARTGSDPAQWQIEPLIEWKTGHPTTVGFGQNHVVHNGKVYIVPQTNAVYRDSRPNFAVFVSDGVTASQVVNQDLTDFPRGFTPMGLAVHDGALRSNILGFGSTTRYRLTLPVN